MHRQVDDWEVRGGRQTATNYGDDKVLFSAILKEGRWYTGESFAFTYVRGVEYVLLIGLYVSKSGNESLPLLASLS